jgi:hypothetical protein
MVGLFILNNVFILLLLIVGAIYKCNWRERISFFMGIFFTIYLLITVLLGYFLWSGHQELILKY